MNGYETDVSRNSTPHLPRINTGYDTPGSDYMTTSAYTGRTYAQQIDTDRLSFQLGKCAASVSDVSDSSDDGYSGPLQHYQQLTAGRRQSNSTYRADRRQSNSTYTADRRNIKTASSPPEKHSVSRSSSASSTYGHQMSCESSLQNRSTYSAGAANRKLSRTSRIKAFLDNRPQLSPGERQASLLKPTRSFGEGSVGSSFKLSFVESPINAVKTISRASSPDNRKLAWDPPTISDEQYEEVKQRLLKGGKFKGLLTKYFRMERPKWQIDEESDDDGYDTDLDKQLGYELMADEKAQEILKDGVFPEYKQDCRKFRCNPNSYFLRHSLDDSIRMRHRYMSKGESIAVSNQMKNQLTMTNIDLEDNGIGPHGMKYFKNVLHENKHLTTLNLSRNNMGSDGALHLKTALVDNCFLLTLNVADNNFGEIGARHIADILEDNVNLKELDISRNAVGDFGADHISKAMANNVSLRVLDISWNHIGTKGAVHLADSLKKNSELGIFRAMMNGFAERGGKAMVQTLTQNSTLEEVDLSYNRITDAVVKQLSSSLDSIGSLSKLNLAGNCLKLKSCMEFLTNLLTGTTPFKYVNLEGVNVTTDFKGLCNALHVVHNITVRYQDPPASREVTTDPLTRNLTKLCEFMAEEDIEVEDIFPDYDEDEDPYTMITIKEALLALETCGLVTRMDKIARLRAKTQTGKKRKFQVREFALVYEHVVCGNDTLREKPLRTHLRRSIKEEREEKERKEKKKQQKSVFVPSGSKQKS